MGMDEDCDLHPLLATGKEVIVDVHCGAAVSRGSDIYKKGILGMSASGNSYFLFCCWCGSARFCDLILLV